MSFDYKITCPNNCSNNGVCTDSGVCKCNKNYILTDCSFYYDGNNNKTFEFRLNAGEFITNTINSFRLDFFFRSLYNFTDIRIEITGLPSGSNSSSGEFKNGTLNLISFESLHIILPSKFSEQLILEIKLKLKYQYLNFWQNEQIKIDQFAQDKSFLGIFLIKIKNLIKKALLLLSSFLFKN